MGDATKRRGCDVCRKRHIKCDRERPSCSQCQRAGWTCPGYPADLAFVNYSQSFPSGRSKPLVARGREIRAKETRERTDSGSSTARSDQATEGRSVELVPRSRTGSKPPVLIAPASSTEILRTQWVWGYEQQSLPASFETQSIYPYLRFVPAYIGQSAALDATVRFVALASSLPPAQRNLATASEPSRRLLSAYTASIRALADAVGDPMQVKTSPVLAATLLLQLYETWCSQDNPRRALHAGAVTLLIQHRGPNAFKNNDFDTAILESELANIVFSCLRAGTACFLATPRWTNIILNIAPDKASAPGRYTPAQRETFCAWVYIPGAVVGFHELIRARLTTPGTSPESRMSPESSTATSQDTAICFTPTPADFTGFERDTNALLHRVQAIRAKYPPTTPASKASPAAAMYELAMEVATGTVAAMCYYMLATVVAVTSPGDADVVESFVADASVYMDATRAWWIRMPNHPFFASGTVRNSIKSVWVKLRDHPEGLVSQESERIAALIDSVFAR